MFTMSQSIALSILMAAAALSFSQSTNSLLVSDDSDWWSIIRKNDSAEVAKPQELDIPVSNFLVLGVKVGKDDLEGIQKKLGTARVVGRGDASTGRSQICYIGANGQTYLLFEMGEVQYAFYLFDHGPEWSGRDQCTRSKLVTSSLRTGSGLHLGQSQGDVQAILGKPTVRRRNDQWVYFKQIRKKSSAAEMKKAREYYSNLSDKEFHENYDFYDLSVYIVAKFKDGRLVYLGVSKSDTY
jgi:hypothetical protein